MVAQYHRIKSGLPEGTLLLFRLGDFYELFFEDAQSGAQLLNVALTKRGAMPMCGIPARAADMYIAKLLKAGRRVAICEQVEDPQPGQLVKREVTQILSPGTHCDERVLVAEMNNYLAAVCFCSQAYGLALADLTTGDFLATELASAEELLSELHRASIKEIIFPGENVPLRDMLRSNAPANTNPSSAAVPHSPGWMLNGYEDWVFAPETAIFTVREHFKVASLEGFGLKDRAAAIGAAGGILHYLTQQLRREVLNLTRIRFYERSEFLRVDTATLRHLEVLEPVSAASVRSATLFGALNRTITPMGARRLREWLAKPLATAEPILQRQEAITQMLADTPSHEALRQQLGLVRDLERTLGRLAGPSGNARDLVALRTGLEALPRIKETIAALLARKPSQAAPELLREAEAASSGTSASSGLVRSLAGLIRETPELAPLIARAIGDEPPVTLKEGGMIRDGFDAALDELRAAARGGKDWVAKLQQDEMERTGIPSLKVRFNSVFGYYIEVTRSHLTKVPAHYARKQTIAGGERFITPELKEMEGKILGAEERAVKLEYELFHKLREEVIGRLAELQESAGALAQLDALGSLAETARLLHYCRPDIRDEGVLEIVDGRHPVLEQSLTEERFVPNDAKLDSATQIMLITGPNMAGKSTYIRQVALLALLAHTGSFLPAAKARVDLLDRIFTRIGASDDLSRGQSTFMVEMCETANILNHATPRSLVVLDEIGRGTSTFDGLSLAWAIVEFLHNQTGAKTLFATHYHELTELAGRLPRLKNLNVAVREWHDQIVFLRKIVEGSTDKSYGIQVARLAGVPRPVLDRAKEILRNLEESELTPEGNVRPMTRRERDRVKLRELAPPPQMDLFT